MNESNIFFIFLQTIILIQLFSLFIYLFFVLFPQPKSSHGPQSGVASFAMMSSLALASVVFLNSEGLPPQSVEGWPLGQATWMMKAFGSLVVGPSPGV